METGPQDEPHLKPGDKSLQAAQDSPSGQAPLDQTNLPARIERVTIASNRAGDGYVEIHRDQQGLPEHIELIHVDESIKSGKFVGFSIYLTEPALRERFNQLQHLEGTPNILIKLTDLLGEAQSEAERLKLHAPKVTRNASLKKGAPLETLPCGDTLEYHHSTLPSSIAEWGYEQQRFDVSLLRRSSGGEKLAEVKTHLVTFPDGAAIREVHISDHRSEESRNHPYHYLRVSRTADDRQVSDSSIMDIFDDLRHESVETFLTPYSSSRRNRARSSNAQQEKSASGGIKYLDYSPALEESGAHTLDSGAQVIWNLESQRSTITIQSSPQDNSSSITFTQASSTLQDERIQRILKAILSEETDYLQYAASNLISGSFSITYKLLGDRSARIGALTNGLLEQMPHKNLVPRSFAESPIQPKEIFMDIVRGHEWVRFVDQRFIHDHQHATTRAAVGVSFRLWQGGCDLIRLDEIGGQQTSIYPTNHHLVIGNIPQLRRFLLDQLKLFSDNPLSLLSHHMQHGAQVTPVFGFQADLDLTTRLSFLGKLMEIDRGAESYFFANTSLRHMAARMYMQEQSNTLEVIDSYPLKVLLHLGSHGIDSISIQHQTSWTDLWQRLKGTYAPPNYPLPPVLGHDPVRAYGLLYEIVDELIAAQRQGLLGRISKKNVSNLVQQLIDERLAQDPGPDSSESRENQQQSAAQNVQASNPGGTH